MQPILTNGFLSCKSPFPLELAVAEPSPMEGEDKPLGLNPWLSKGLR